MNNWARDSEPLMSTNPYHPLPNKEKECIEAVRSEGRMK